MGRKSKKKKRIQSNKATITQVHPQRLLGKLWQHLKVLPVLVWGVITALSVFGGLSAYFVFWPSLSVSDIQTNHQNIASMKFLISNDGLFPIYNVKVSCNFTITKYEPNYDGPKMDSSVSVAFPYNVYKLEPKGKLSESCQFDMLSEIPKIRGTSGILATPEEILNHATVAHLSMFIIFNPFFLWPDITVQFPFKMDRDKDQFYWVPEPLEKYNAAIKEKNDAANIK